MGVTISYRGQLDDVSLLLELLLGVERFCFKRGWEYSQVDERIIGRVERYNFTEVDVSDQFDDDWPVQVNDVHYDTEVFDVDDHIRGLLIQPHPDCETVRLLFDRQGRLRHYMATVTPGHYTEWDDFWVKTQFAPIEVHIAICELLRLVKDNYMPALEVTDEGGYWETGDREKLAMYLGFISDKMRELMNTGLAEFKQFLDEKRGDSGPKIEMGKKVEVREPEWKQGWGQSAGEN